MKLIPLNNAWSMCREGDPTSYPCSVPCSVYHTLLTAGAMDDPFYRENADAALPLSEEDYRFTRRFLSPETTPGTRMALCFDGIDTLAEIFLDGQCLGRTDNMHRRWRFDVTGLPAGEHTLSVLLRSPLRYIAQKQAERPMWGVSSTVPGFPYLRKAHYMFGWDWGPVLPDMGLWREVRLELWQEGRISGVQYTQVHGEDRVTLTAAPVWEEPAPGQTWDITVLGPDGELVMDKAGLTPQETVTETIAEPRLWWPNGLGEHPLYLVTVTVRTADGNESQTLRERIGLRTITIRQEKDEWGESFCLHVNGRDVFAMGANWIPTDALLPRCTPEKTQALLQACVDANFNMVRVWGGGFYPGEDFYDFCDENGLVVWQDFMFACANYRLTPEFWETTEAELRDNICRLRHHASLGLGCGTNEIETAFETWGLPDDPAARADYLEQFAHRMPELVCELDPQRFYWRSSPSAYGGCVDTSSNHAGDMHYWEIWHSFKPFTAFRELSYRFCSEYGFESVPSPKTMRTVCDPAQRDLNLMSPVMEAHQKCEQGNEKLMYYLAQLVRYPESCEELSYLSQLMQAECIRSNVEHMRRHRGRCMGSLYWQLGDTNPVISWSSIDYFGRWKGLHYYARRFHAPVLLSCGAFGEPTLNVSNETLQPVEGTVRWAMRDADSRVIISGASRVQVPALSAVDLPAITGLESFYTKENRRCHYLSYALETPGGVLSSGISLLCRPKEFSFRKAQIRLEVRKLPDCYAITVCSDAFVQALALDCRTMDVRFSDNWFPLHAWEPVTITCEKKMGLSIDLLRQELFVLPDTAVSVL